MKRKFTNAQCAHVWCAQSQSDGHSDNMRFEGAQMWSYGAHIASIVSASPKRKVLLITSRTYSTTTQQHKSLVSRAWRGDAAFAVPDLGAPNAKIKPDHKRNKEYLTKQYVEWREKLMKSQADSWGEWKRDHLRDLSYRAFFYCELFNLADPRIDWEADALEAEARIARLRESPGYKARAAAREARAEQALIEYERRQAEWAARNVVNKERWLNGEIVHFYSNDPVYLRRIGDLVQTSMSAYVPMRAAQTLFNFVREVQVPWSGSINIGSFTATHLSEERTLTAGCHTIRWPEIEDFARRMGWLSE